MHLTGTVLNLHGLSFISENMLLMFFTFSFRIFKTCLKLSLDVEKDITFQSQTGILVE